MLPLQVRLMQPLEINDRDDNLATSLTNNTLSSLLKSFFDEQPHMEQFLCKGLGLELMGVDGQIANMVINYFTKQNRKN